MKITIAMGAFFPVPPIMGGAVEKVWFTLAAEFVKRGHEVAMVSRKTPGLPREETINGVKHLRVGGFDTPRSLVWLQLLDLIYSSPPAIGDRDKIILFVGRVHPEKGVHLLIDAFASDARAAFVNWKLMIIGPTETKLGGGGEVYLASIRRAAGKADGRISFAG